VSEAAASCWDQIVEGYSFPNTERNARAGYYALENDGYEGVNIAVNRAINVLDSSPRGIPGGAIYRGG
jgi:hypothetical protein